MKEFFIHDGRIEKGPLNLDQLKQEILNPDTPIWHEGLENWTTVGEIEELKGLIKSKLKPPPLNPILENKESSGRERNFKESVEPIKKSKKINYTLVAVIGGFLIVVFWLGFKNQKLSDDVYNVQSKITVQEQILTQQEIKQQEQEKQKILEEDQRLVEENKRKKERELLNKKLTAKFMGYRNNWYSYISASSNAYTYSELGGISDLQVIVYNQTDKTIDEVQVQINYIKANGGLYKTEKVSATNIGPNASKSISAPSSDRGTSVKMSIESITAKSFNFCFPYGMAGNKDFDPYFCK